MVPSSTTLAARAPARNTPSNSAGFVVANIATAGTYYLEFLIPNISRIGEICAGCKIFIQQIA